MPEYTIIRSNRKTISIHITPEGTVEVRCPRRMPVSEIHRLVASREQWIQTHLAKVSARPKLPPFTREELQSLAKQASADLPLRTERFARQIGVSYGRITIRAQHTRWGSCTAKGNLNFNCLLMLAPESVRDYVVVHELCHRKEMNHSPRFWAEVEKILPDYAEHKQWLKTQGQALISRLPK